MISPAEPINIEKSGDLKYLTTLEYSRWYYSLRSSRLQLVLSVGYEVFKHIILDINVPVFGLHIIVTNTCILRSMGLLRIFPFRAGRSEVATFK